MLNKMFFYIFIFSLMFVIGCFSFNFKITSDDDWSKSNKDSETVLIANTNNVYRFATNTILRVKIQQKKNGKWTECENRVLIPENWFIVSDDGIK